MQKPKGAKDTAARESVYEPEPDVKRKRPTLYERETGFGQSAEAGGARMMTADGKANVVQKGLPYFRPYDAYHNLLRMGWWTFMGMLSAFYFGLNLLFASIYVLIGVEELKGMDNQGLVHNFWQAFFFSVQTLSTVGYGSISPHGIAANAVSSLEIFLGWLYFAITTGVLYGRFSHPRARLLWSREAIIAPFMGGNAFMFRLASARSSAMIEPEVTVLYSHVEKDQNGQLARRFFNMPLQLRQVNLLTLSWTVVHPIDSQSPLWNKSKEDLQVLSSEVLILLKGFDDTYSQVVHSRRSYHHSDIVWGATFPRIYQSGPDGRTEVHLHRISEFEPATLNPLDSEPKVPSQTPTSVGVSNLGALKPVLEEAV